ncbi:capsule biosynthesis GfcC family protein [Vibrio sp. J1-1]|uniref:capsule biosynthesis GfcC family protein n=1 Tax=Vibrio sp. J1-1 TaxID=2912251 RepID=UPI001F1BBB13|nr:capsule biosynthesis GfcC family protein [Vibrio sp. J1-1]MBR9873091.1 YjbG polysaccharide synthesis-related protein [Vibrionaceae bacterium]MCF7482079.1 capsule biosynthesis GfcC family protein [Vibrio sp. J1-1]
MSTRLLSLLSLALLTCTSVASAQSSPNNASSLNVDLVGTGKQLQFQQAARLSDVLKQAQQQNLILLYPLGTTLFDGSEKALRESTSLKNSVLNQMIQYNLVAHPFYKYIQKHQFAPRVFSAVDLDDVRLDKINNPLLAGDLALVSSQREEKVIYLGNLDKVYSVKEQTGIPLKQQITNLKRNIGELAHPPILIYPDGNVVQPHHGSWLTTQYYVPPLTMVYIPFEEFETSEMDQDIVKLLTQLKPISMKSPL